MRDFTKGIAAAVIRVLIEFLITERPTDTQPLIAAVRDDQPAKGFSRKAFVEKHQGMIIAQRKQKKERGNSANGAA